MNQSYLSYSTCTRQQRTMLQRQLFFILILKHAPSSRCKQLSWHSLYFDRRPDFAAIGLIDLWADQGVKRRSPFEVQAEN
jgi:hypothetical protein